MFTKIFRRSCWLTLLGASCFAGLAATAQDAPSIANNDQTLPAGNDVARVMREFKGRGDLGDGSQPAAPQETLERLKVPDDLQVELVTAEPTITQPLHVSFDFRGRMWVVQYRQYPFPAGLKVVRYDQHLRAVFDRVPEPPPHHILGKDCVTVFEDTDGDGNYDSQRDVITGLNIATSRAVSPQGIWVMNPPYLLFYGDPDHDAVVDQAPEVHLAGFGLEDTHSVANSIRLGPDGWLYGANGSTTTAAIRAPLSEHPDQVTAFQGQCIWRYHPTQHRFEIFAEGGGNTFGLEIDAAGLTFSGTNGGNTRGMFYPQGSYGEKTWGKHGPLTNPYAFGYFNHMRFEGDARRFTQSLVVYQDDALPERYHDQIIAINPLQRCVISSTLSDDTSSFRTADFEQTIETDDRWFRPVNIAVGPDGAVYLADWYDTRLTHVDPRDNWHKSSGRVYRLRSKNPQAASPSNESFGDILPSRTRFDLFALDSAALLKLLRHPSRTIVFSCQDVLAASPDPQLNSQLSAILHDGDDTRRLSALWVLSRREALGDQDLEKLLSDQEPDASLRRWAIRLIGDRREATSAQATVLASLAESEPDVRVRSQLASSAARLPSVTAIPILERMLRRDADSSDLHLPLLIWWALESQCTADPTAVTELFTDATLWETSLVHDTMLSRLMRRFASAGTEADYLVCARLLRLAPGASAKQILMRGFEEAFAGRTVDALPEALQEELAVFRGQMPQSDLPLRLRQGDADALAPALQQLADTDVSIEQRVKLIETLGETKTVGAIDALQQRVARDASVAIKRAALQALSRFDDPQIGRTIAASYHNAMDDSNNLREMAIRTLGSRPAWAPLLLEEIAAARIAAERVPADVVMQMRSMDQPELNAALERLWGTVRETPEEKQKTIEHIKQVVTDTEQVDFHRGKELFKQHCGKCHTLFAEGGRVGPDLTGYERTNLDFLTHAIVDPSAAVREEFTNYRMLTADGQVLNGLLENQTPQTLTLRTAEGQAVQIQREAVEDLSASPVSLMPENLLAPLSVQEIRDLFAYLIRRSG